MDEIQNEIVLPRVNLILTNNSIIENNNETTTYVGQQKIKNEITSVCTVNPLRTNFRKSHTCGSLYAKCDCDCNVTTITTPTTGTPTINSTNSTNTINSEKRRAFFQTYSHPDTPFIFTNENRNPLDKLIDNRNNKNREHNIFCTKDGKVEITNSKRLSTPNIGNYSLLDVAVHPEIILKVTKGIRRQCSESPVKTVPHRCDSETKSCSDDFQIITRRTKSESATIKLKNQVDEEEKSEETLRDSIESLDDNKSSVFSSGRNSSKSSTELPIKFAQIETDYETDLYEDVKTANNLVFLKYNALSYQQETIDPAHRFFQESGILGPMGNGTSNLNRKSSKVTDSNIRKNSKAFQSKKSSFTEDDLLRSIVAKKETKSYQDEINNLKEIIKKRDDDINKLKREIHKLKSVLQQTVSGDGDLLSSLQTHHCMAGQQSVNNCVLNKNCNNKLCTINNNNNINQNSNNKCRLPSTAAVKKQGVSGETTGQFCDPTGQLLNDFLITKYEKDFRSKQLIKDAIMENDFLKNIDSSQVRELVDSMYNREVAKGEFVIREGEAGAHLYVSAEGDFEVVKDGKVLGIMGPGKAFGELAILYNCTRTASIRVLKNSKLWVLDRRVFQQIMMRTGMQRIEENVNFLRSVPLLKDLSHDVLTKIADVLEVEFYPVGAYIIRQGASGDTFYLISQGDVQVTQRLADDTMEEEIRTLGRGDYFGEQALIKEDKRTANIIALSPGVECLTLDRESFTQLIGDLCELHEKDYGDHQRVFSLKQSQLLIPTLENIIKKEYLDMKLQDLESVATLGLGGFGRVELVKHKKNNDNEINAYALKCLKKQHIVDTRQEEHVFSERTIMLTCDSSFICRLYRTFKDNKYIYMLLEACMGGEIWTILRDRGNFNDTTTQFIIGCVLQAFDYLHARGIVYRDLKPENLMLDSKGYVKLVDFGFAKYIGYSSKTWTFCGTPEYVAPEIILNKGHDRAVDYWALGILIHELLTGTPPFTASDPMKTYNIILKGIDMVDFPRHMSRSAISLIKRLCRDVPVERLGYQKGRIQDIKKHKWFQGFDWDGLANLKLLPPIIHPIRHPLDTDYFDIFPSDTDIPPDEMSGWDVDF